MTRLVVPAIVALALLAAACSTTGKATEPAAGTQPGRPPVAELRGEPGTGDAARAPASGSSTSSMTAGGRSSSGAAEAAIPPLDRMVIANVNLSLSVDNAVEAARLAERTVERHGGFVAGSTVQDSDHGREATVTLRVPSARLSDALSDLRGLGRRVTDESRTTQDVTEEFTDIESNVRNLRATEAQLLALMERASKMDEVLMLQRELTGIRGQIERLEGRRRVLENRSDYATIAMKLVEPVASSRPDGWNPLETGARAFAALERFAERAGTVVIWLVVFAPVYGPLVALGWWVARRTRATVARPPAAAV